MLAILLISSFCMERAPRFGDLAQQWFTMSTSLGIVRSCLDLVTWLHSAHQMSGHQACPRHPRSQVQVSYGKGRAHTLKVLSSSRKLEQASSAKYDIRVLRSGAWKYQSLEVWAKEFIPHLFYILLLKEHHKPTQIEQLEKELSSLNGRSFKSFYILLQLLFLFQDLEA